MTSDQYNWCLTVFFFSYAAFEVPSNLLLKKLRPSRWLPLIMVAWGTVMTLMGIVRSYSGLLAARFFLGVAEAGLFPGCAVSNRFYLEHSILSIANTAYSIMWYDLQSAKPWEGVMLILESQSEGFNLKFQD